MSIIGKLFLKIFDFFIDSKRDRFFASFKTYFNDIFPGFGYGVKNGSNFSRIMRFWVGKRLNFSSLRFKIFLTFSRVQ